jgi:hypothetical protein
VRLVLRRRGRSHYDARVALLGSLLLGGVRLARCRGPRVLVRRGETARQAHAVAVVRDRLVVLRLRALGVRFPLLWRLLRLLRGLTRGNGRRSVRGGE